MRSVWTLEGQIRGTIYKFSTAPMDGFDPVLAEPPGNFTYGLSDTVGAIERLDVQVTLINDGRFDQLAMGTSGGFIDFEGPSFRDFRGQICRYTAEGVQVRMTPPLRVSAIDVEVGTITLTLQALEQGALGPSSKLSTVSEWRNRTIYRRWSHPRLSQILNIPNEDIPGFFQALIDASNDEIIPWLYGPQVVELKPVSSDGVWQIAGIIDPATTNTMIVGGHYLTYYRASGTLTSADDSPLALVVASHDHVGDLLVFYVPGGKDTEILVDLAFREENPVTIIGRILDDHAAPGSYDVASLEAAKSSAVRLEGVVAGQYGDAASIEEILAAIAPIAGIEAYLGIDGKLHFVSLPENLTPTAHIDPYDIYPSGTDRIPAATASLASNPPLYGSVVGKISIDWPAWSKAIYPHETGNDHRIVSNAEGEVRLEGAWIRPDKATVALSAATEWFGYPVRLVTIPTHISVMESIEPGSIVTFQVPTLPGSERRIGIVRFIEIAPADETAFVTVGDLGWEGMVKNGVLDSFHNWVLYQPQPGETITLNFAAGTITFSEGKFDTDLIGRNVWVFGSPIALNNRSYLIVAQPDRNTLAVSPPPPFNSSFVEDGSLKAVVLKNAGTDDYSSIEGKIAASSQPNFKNEERAYRFSR